LHRENRRMKKDLAAAVISKESAKAKQDVSATKFSCALRYCCEC
jgi:hypothetical protein